MPSLGFAMGIERLLMLMDKQSIEIPKPSTCDLYVAVMGEKASLKSFEISKLSVPADLLPKPML